MGARFTVLAVCLFGWTAVAAAQQPVAVQLPTFSQFSVSTTVVVPDSGGAPMGRLSRAMAGWEDTASPILPRANRRGGLAIGAAGSRVGAQIHDFDRMDQALRGRGTATDRDGTHEVSPALKWASRLPSGPNDVAPLRSIAELRAQHAQSAQAAECELAQLIEKADALVLEGKPGVARIYYQMAARRAPPSLQEKLAIRIAALSTAPAPASLSDPRQQADSRTSGTTRTE
ncbi:MAG: hypothetical protein ACOY3P_24425 [Planctomycetota bacterium]